MQMVVRCRAVLVAFLVIHLAAMPVIAQTTVQRSDAPNWHQLSQRLESGTRLEIITMTGETVTGLLLTASDSAFTLSMSNRPELPYPQSRVPDRSIEFGDIQSLTYDGSLKNVDRQRILRRIVAGVLVGAGVAVITGLLVALKLSRDCGC
jgi:hypothetical protein